MLDTVSSLVNSGHDMFLIGFQTGNSKMTNVATSEKYIGIFSPQYEAVATDFFVCGTFPENDDVLRDSRVCGLDVICSTF